MILRVLYAAELEKPDADGAKLEKLPMVARELKEALPIVMACKPTGLMDASWGDSILKPQS